MAQDLVGRVKRLLLSPQSEWDVIDGETVEPQGLVTNYVAPLAAIPAVAGLIGTAIVGTSFLGATYRAPIGGALASAVVAFVLAIVGVFVFAFVINALAPSFGAQKNFNQALKVSAYAPTAGWVAGIFTLIPMLGILALLGGLYSLYLIFVGLPKMMKPPAEKATTYTIVSILVAIVAYVIIGLAASAFTPGPGIGGYSSNNAASSEMERRAEALERAAETGDFGAVLGAASGMFGGDPDAPVADATALGDLAPRRVAGMDRTSLDTETLSAPFKASTMTARYGGADKSMTLKVTNSPMISAMMGMAGLTGAAYDRRSDNGYERLRRDGDAIVVEEWDASSKRGRYARSVGGAFLIEAEGRGVDMKELERAVAGFKERDLKNLKPAS